jgi:hypothetical protein
LDSNLPLANGDINRLQQRLQSITDFFQMLIFPVWKQQQQREIFPFFFLLLYNGESQITLPNNFLSFDSFLFIFFKKMWRQFQIDCVWIGDMLTALFSFCYLSYFQNDMRKDSATWNETSKSHANNKQQAKHGIIYILNLIVFYTASK